MVAAKVTTPVCSQCSCVQAPCERSRSDPLFDGATMNRCSVVMVDTTTRPTLHSSNVSHDDGDELSSSGFNKV